MFLYICIVCVSSTPLPAARPWWAVWRPGLGRRTHQRNRSNPPTKTRVSLNGFLRCSTTWRALVTSSPRSARLGSRAWGNLQRPHPSFLIHLHLCPTTTTTDLPPHPHIHRWWRPSRRRRPSSRSSTASSPCTRRAPTTRRFVCGC